MRMTTLAKKPVVVAAAVAVAAGSVTVAMLIATSGPLKGRQAGPAPSTAPAPTPGAPSPSPAVGDEGNGGAAHGTWNGYGAWRAYAGPPGAEGDDESLSPVISANGRWVAYWSTSSNLVPRDTNRANDVFVTDRATGRTTRVSVSNSGKQANDASEDPAISADGRWIAFTSYASNLVPGDTNRCTTYRDSRPETCSDVFVYDQLTHRVSRVSVSSSGGQANGFSRRPAISADGRYVAFTSNASTLVRGDTNRSTDIFLHDRSSGSTIMVSRSRSGGAADAGSTDPSISGDGTVVSFTSWASNLTAQAPQNCTFNGRPTKTYCLAIFVRDVHAGRTVRVTHQTKESEFSVVSGNGRFVAFTSSEDDLVSGDTNKVPDAFVYDRETRSIERVSASSGGEQGDGMTVERPALSRDGRYVGFVSEAQNLVPNDTNVCHTDMGDAFPCPDAFVRDRTAGTTQRVSVGSSGAQGNDATFSVAVSADARHVAFGGGSGNLVGGTHRPCLEWANCPDIFARDRTAGVTDLISRASPRSHNGSTVTADGNSTADSISSDGRFVAFSSYASDMVRDDTNGTWDVFVRDRTRKVISRISVSSSGRQADGESTDIELSGDGSAAAFVSEADNLVPGDTNGVSDIFVRDFRKHTTTRVSVSSTGEQGDKESSAPWMSADGRYITFTSEATNLVPGDTNGALDVFIYDRQSRSITRASVSSRGSEGLGASSAPMLSSNGRLVVFSSTAPNLVAGDTNGALDIFVRDLVAGTTTRVSVGPEGLQADGDSFEPSISGDGRWIAFSSRAQNLPGATEYGDGDLYLVDRTSGAIRHVASEEVHHSRLSADGRFLTYTVGLNPSVARYDRLTDTQTPVTRCSDTFGPSISADGRYVAFTDVCDLSPGDRNSLGDVVVDDMTTGRYERESIPFV